MQGLRWNYMSVALAVFAVFYIVEALPSHRVKRQEDTNIVDQSDLNPIDSEDTLADGLDREKRKLPESTFAAKNAILGFVFGASQNSAGGSIPRPTKVPITTTTDDTPDFDRAKVMLDIPDELFGNSFRLVTNISKTFGDFLMNSARRYGQFVQHFKPVLGKALTVKGIQLPTTTRKPKTRSL